MKKQLTLLPEDEVRNKENDRPWMRSDTDKMLDIYFEGSDPRQIAVRFNRNPKAIFRKIDCLTYNEFNKALDYKPLPGGRLSRVGKRFTPNELKLIKDHRARKIPAVVTARITARKVSEIETIELKDKAKLKVRIGIIPELDLIMALRYAYFKWSRDLPSANLPHNTEYDNLVHEACEFGGKSGAFERIKKIGVDQYPFRIRSLANYIVEMKKEDRSGTLDAL